MVIHENRNSCEVFKNKIYRNIINPENVCVCVYFVIKSSRDADSPRRRSPEQDFTASVDNIVYCVSLTPNTAVCGP